MKIEQIVELCVHIFITENLIIDWLIDNNSIHIIELLENYRHLYAHSHRHKHTHTHTSFLHITYETLNPANIIWLYNFIGIRLILRAPRG